MIIYPAISNIRRHNLASKHELIEIAEWGEISLRLTKYADDLIRQHTWKGERAYISARHVVLADGRDARDYAMQAIQDLLNPDAGRKWDHEKNPDILSYLKSAVKSMISNASRSVENRDTRSQYRVGSEDPEDTKDILDVTPDTRTNAVEKIEIDENIASQKEVVEELRRSVAGDRELVEVLEALENEIYKTGDIEKLTGKPAARVSELKRKLCGRLERIQQSRLKHL